MIAPIALLAELQVRSGSKTLGYAYDAAGNRTLLVYPTTGQQVTYTYDAAERMASVSDWNGNTVSYGYDEKNRLSTVTYPAASLLSSSYGYDDDDRLTSITHTQNGSTLFSFGYTYDAASNRKTKTTAAATETYVLDALNRLTSVTYPGQSATLYTYDGEGNRKTLGPSGSPTTYTYDNADRLTSVTPYGGSAQTVTPDANGSQTAKGSDTFTWDAESHLTSETVSGTTYTATYDGDGLRITRTTGGTTTNFVWDVAAGLPSIADDGTQYVYGLALVSRVTGSATFYYLADGLGSTIALANAAGSVVQTYTYDVFGAVQTSSGTQPTEYQFAGQETDPTGLQYLRARYYDPSTGRLLSRDPKPDYTLDPARHQPYAYAGSNPVLYSDPSGKYYPCDYDCADCIQQMSFPCWQVGPVGGPSNPDLLGGLIRSVANFVHSILPTIAPYVCAVSVDPNCLPESMLVSAIAGIIGNSKDPTTCAGAITTTLAALAAAGKVLPAATNPQAAAAAILLLLEAKGLAGACEQR